MDEQEIFRMADDFVQSTKSPDGSTAINPQNEGGMRLLANGAIFPDFSLESLCAALAASPKTISPAHNISYIHSDHVAMWAWCAQIIAHNDTEYFRAEESNLKLLVQIIAHTAKAAKNPSSSPPRDNYPMTLEGSMEFAEAHWTALKQVALPSTVEQFLHFRSEITSYLSFPLLEGILKKRCSEFVEYDGLVKKEFTIPRGKRPYVPGSKINSLAVLLFLYFHEVANEFEKKYFPIATNHLQTFIPEKHAFWMIYEWRNESLHGQSDHTGVGGVLLSISLLIAIASLGDRFVELRERRKILIAHNFPAVSPTIFYPPINR